MSHNHFPEAPVSHVQPADLGEAALQHEQFQLQQLKELRIATKFSETQRTLGYELSGQDTVERFLLPDDSKGAEPELPSSAWIDDSLSSASGSRVLTAIGKSVGYDDLTQSVRNLGSAEKLELPFAAGLNLQIQKLGDTRNRISYRLDKDDTQDENVLLTGLISFGERYKLTTKKFSSARAELAAGVKNGDVSTYSKESFNFDDNPEELMDLLQIADLRINGLSRDESANMRKHKTIEALYGLPVHYADDTVDGGEYRSRAGVYFDEQGQITKVVAPTTKPGAYVCLKPNEIKPGGIDELNLHVGIELDVPEMYAELDYNGYHHEGVLPFVETETATQIVGSLEAAGLQFSDRFKQSVAEIGKIETRYGHAYSELTREVAKLVDDPSRSYDKLLQGDGNIVEQIRSISEVTDPAAQAFIALLKGSVERSAVADVNTPELKLTAKRIDIKDGGCKDAEVYISDSKRYVVDQEGRRTMLVSAYSRPSAITLMPMVLAGVKLPAGSLLAVEDDGYALMRLTAFAFDAEQAAITFGAQDAENRKHYMYDRGNIERVLQR